MSEFPRIRFDLLEKTFYWTPHLNEDGERWAKPGADPFEAYQYHFTFWHALPKKARYWGYETLYYEHQWFETFGLWWFNLSWRVASSYARCERREERLEDKGAS